MPYYSELGIYTPSSSYTSPLLKGPYSGHSSIVASNILPPSSKQFRSNFRGFKPHLTTISESNIGAPLRRISSPKVLYHTSPKVRVSRPVKINTSDIDVSVNRYSKRQREEPPKPEPEPPNVIENEAKPSKEIRRDRATIRLQTIHKDTLEKEIGQIKSWRDNFQPDELAVEAKRRKKSPGEILKEKFLIRSKSKDNVPNLEPPTLSRKLSVKKSPSFKDICDVITSDQAVEDLNPGQPFEVRRRQSRQTSHDDILKEIQRSSSTLSVEEVQILDALLEAEKEVGLFDEPPVIEEEPNKAVKKKKIKKTESAPSSKLRKDSSLKDMVKDISQVEIEMIPVKQKPVITGYIGNIEEKVTNNLKAIMEDLKIEETSKQPEIKEKKFRFNVTVQEFPVKKKINFPKHELKKDNYSTIQIPSVQVPVVTSILKKRVDKSIGQIAGNGKVVKKKLEKSLSEVQVRNKQDIAIKKSESNDSVHSNFTVKVNNSNSASKDSLHGSGKLKIIAIEKADIPKPLEDPKETANLFQSTKRELKRDTFLSKARIEDKKPIVNLRKTDDDDSNKKETFKTVEVEKTSESVENKCQEPAKENNAIKEEVAPSNFSINKEAVEIANKLEDKNIEAKNNQQKQENNKSDETAEFANDNNVLREVIAPPNLDFNKLEAKNTEIKKTQQQLEENNLKNNKTIEFAKEHDIIKETIAPSPPNIDKKKPDLKKNEPDLNNFWSQQNEENSAPPKLSKLKLEQKDPKTILKEIQENRQEPETPEEQQKRIISKRSLIEKLQKNNKSDPDLRVFEPPTPPPPEPAKEPTPEPSFVPLQSNRLSQWMHPWKKPEQQNECPVEIFAKPKYIRARHIPRRWQQNRVEDSESEDSTTSEEEDSSSEESEEGEEAGALTKIGTSTSSNDSGFDSGRAKEKDSIDSRDSPGNTLTPASNPAFALDFNDLPEEVSQSSTYQSFQRSGRITPPATTIPRFRKYCLDDFSFLKVLGKGSFGKVLLAELTGTEYYYAIKCLKKDVVLEDDDVECTLIERKVLALGTKHPYLCHLLCTFQTESHLFFVMEYLNGGDLMFHIQAERRFSEARARFYGAEIVSGLKFLHNKGIVYRDLKLDNILLDFDGHVRIADFGMCKLQIFLDRMADTFCGTPDYMAPEIIKGQHYNQCVDWWSFGVLLYEMLLGQSPFSGSDEDELFWSICNEKPVIPRFLSAEAGSVLIQFLEKDANKRLGNRFSPHGDIQDHAFFKPIDWTALEARHLEPPFKPNLQHPLDTQYFDKTFTTERAKLTPIEGGILQSMDQTQFQGFSYTNPNATDK